MGEKINLLFQLHQTVKLPKEIHPEATGIILAIFIVDRGIQYQVRYFWEGKVQEVYFYEWELSAQKE